MAVWISGRFVPGAIQRVATLRAAPLREALMSAACALCALVGVARSEGVTAYLPLNLEPEIERQIERALILADEPILKRPFAVELVRDALPQACRVDKALCLRVERYLKRYSGNYGVTHASLAAAATSTHDGTGVVPNQHGLPVSSNHEVSVAAFVQPNDYILATVGAVSYNGRTVPTGTLLSAGFHWAQLDIGYRDHWLSPLTDSSTLLSTEAPTLPSATLSNYEPLTRLGFQYELFLARMSQTGSNSGRSLTGPNILFNGVASRGNPNLFGMQLSIEPFPGWSLGVNRLLQYGGGGGLPSSARLLLRNFFKPSGLAQDQGNQQASYLSRFIFPGKTPFAVYFQYAGEDNANGGSYLLGSPSLSGGIDFPKLWHHFDLTYEVAEWSNIWYVHNVYLDGMSNYGLVNGNWGADQRNFGDGVGARSQMLRVGWEPPFGGYLEERVRTLQNQNYYGGDRRTYAPTPAAFPYRHYYDYSVRYSRAWKMLTVGSEFFGGRDVFGKSLSRLSAFVRYNPDAQRPVASGADDDDDATQSSDHDAEWFVDAGLNANKIRVSIKDLPSTGTQLAYGPHFGLGARRATSANNDLGVRLELDQVAGHLLVGVRPIDFRHRYSAHFAVSAFAGVARYDVATPATSVYGGLGAQWRDIVKGWDLNLDLRHGQNLMRDHVLATDVRSVGPDTFYKINSATFYLSRRF